MSEPQAWGMSFTVQVSGFILSPETAEEMGGDIHRAIAGAVEEEVAKRVSGSLYAIVSSPDSERVTYMGTPMIPFMLGH